LLARVDAMPRPTAVAAPQVAAVAAVARPALASLARVARVGGPVAQRSAPSAPPSVPPTPLSVAPGQDLSVGAPSVVAPAPVGAPVAARDVGSAVTTPLAAPSTVTSPQRIAATPAAPRAGGPPVALPRAAAPERQSDGPTEAAPVAPMMADPLLTAPDPHLRTDPTLPRAADATPARIEVPQGPDQAQRVAVLDAIDAARRAQPLQGLTLHVDDASGQTHRIRVDLRGDRITAEIGAPSLAAASALHGRSAALQAQLAAQGFDVTDIRVAALDPMPELSGRPPSGQERGGASDDRRGGDAPRDHHQHPRRRPSRHGDDA
jgi:hypothetical protein